MTHPSIWQDKVAIVTGGSSGIGKATALALAKQGTNVLITGRNLERLSKVAGLHDRLQPLQADSSEPDTAARIVETALQNWNRLDLLVNNSGAGHPLPIPAYAPEMITTMSAVNIMAPSLLVHAAQSALSDSHGAIVNISTAVSNNAAPILAHYAATKAALEHLTRSWAMELADKGIRVNAVSPGPVKSGALTGMMGLPEATAKAIEAQEAQQIPLGRRGVTEDIVPWILQLGSPENAWLTGQVLTIDGGWSLRT